MLMVGIENVLDGVLGALEGDVGVTLTRVGAGEKKHSAAVGQLVEGSLNGVERALERSVARGTAGGGVAATRAHPE